MPANHWARDAVAQLAAKGIVEGYPDGTFKGDRAATRWEMAMVVARMLAKSEQMWATFATKEDLEALKQLVNTLREELDALGVRVDNLEDNLTKLTKRIWALEKIKFYGSVDSIFITQGFKAQDTPDPWGYGANSIYNIHSAIGAAPGVCIRPAGMGVLIAAAPPTGNYVAFPVIDFRSTRPLINGTSFTTVGILGTKIKVSDEVDAGVEFASYTRTGEATIAPYYGVVAPYLSNIFTSDIGLTGLNNLNSPWTKMTLDNIWLIHKPSGTKVQLGSFAKTSFDSEVLHGELNPNTNGPRILPFFGVRVTGKTHFLAPMKFEVLGSKVANDTPGNVANAVYNTIMSGFTLNWLFKRGDFKINFLRVTDDFFGGTRLASGGAENPYGWLNPPEHYAAQVPQQIERPVQAGNNANGLIGPQAQTMWGASIRYKLPNNINFEGVIGSTEYKPNINSGYKVTGEALRAKLYGSLFNNLLDLAVEYAGANPFYDPFTNAFQGVINVGTAYGGGANMSVIPEPIYRFGLFSSGFYQLHNSGLLTNNRSGIRIYATYHLPGGNGNIFGKYGNFEQVGYSATMANGGIQNKPGYVEAFFPGMQGGETTKGKFEYAVLGADYKFPKSKFYAKASYTHYKFRRPTSLTNNFAANNNINLIKGVGKILLTYSANDKFLLKGGYDFAGYKGVYRSIPVNWNYTQTIPYLGFEYKLSDNTCWSLLAEAFNHDDRVSPNIITSGGTWKWSGTRLFSEFKVSF